MAIRKHDLHRPDVGLVFGATATSIQAHPAGRTSIDPQSVFDYLYFHVVPSPRTIFTELPSGEVGRSGPARTLATSFDPAGPEIFRQHLQLMIAAQEVLGFELHVAKQATLAVADLDRETRERCGYQLHGFDHDAHVRAFRAIYAIVDEELPKGRVIDLTHLSGSTDNLLDHVHLTPLGARLVAGAVATHLAH